MLNNKLGKKPVLFSYVFFIFLYGSTLILTSPNFMQKYLLTKETKTYFNYIKLYNLNGQ